MSATNESYAYFTITGSFDPDAIRKRVGVPPTESSSEGEVIRGTQKRRKFSRWSLYSRLERSAELEKHIADVLDQLDKNKNGFRELSLEYGGTMELVGYFRVYYPGIVFEREIVERLAEYSLSIDCDFYFPSSVEDGWSAAAVKPE